VEIVRTVALPFRAPLEADALLGFLAGRAVPGVEEVVDGVYRRGLRLRGGPALIELRPVPGQIRSRFRLSDIDDLPDAIARCRRLLDLDADPSAIAAALGADPIVGPSVRARPGLRVPGHVDVQELAVRAVLGQQVSLSAAATIAGRLVKAHGERLPAAGGAITHLFPTPEKLAKVDVGSLPMPGSRGRALVTLARALARGELALDPGADPRVLRARLVGLPGIGPWTADYIAMRGLSDHDAFPAADLWIRRALGLPAGNAANPAGLADRWRPYRAYAAQHLWAGLPTAAAGR
jgi:AraC family transcriptional regulator of adaptative response / DNA-3-methyladenine glycosylase II